MSYELTYDSVDQAVNSFLNKREFRYLLLSYTGYGFGLNVLNRVSKSEFCLKQGRKISDFCLKQGRGIRGRAAPPHPRIYRVPPRAKKCKKNSKCRTFACTPAPPLLNIDTCISFKLLENRTILRWSR